MRFTITRWLQLIIIVLMIASMLSPWWSFEVKTSSVLDDERGHYIESYYVFRYEYNENIYDSVIEEDNLIETSRDSYWLPNIVSVWTNERYDLQEFHIALAFYQVILISLIVLFLSSIMCYQKQSKYNQFYTLLISVSFVLSLIIVLFFSLFFNHPYHPFIGSEIVDDGFYYNTYSYDPGIGWYLALIVSILLFIMFVLAWREKRIVSNSQIEKE